MFKGISKSLLTKRCCFCPMRGQPENFPQRTELMLRSRKGLDWHLNHFGAYHIHSVLKSLAFFIVQILERAIALVTFLVHGRSLILPLYQWLASSLSSWTVAPGSIIWAVWFVVFNQNQVFRADQKLSGLRRKRIKPGQRMRGSHSKWGPV